MGNFFIIKQKTAIGEKEKRIYEIDSSETKDYFLTGTAVGINMNHCLALGVKRYADFSARVSAYRIVKNLKTEMFSTAVKKVTGEDTPYIAVCFYEKLDSYQAMFVPRRLEIDRRPELNNFPFNVVFMTRCKADDNKITEQTAVYLPDLATYQETGEDQKMKYFNKLNQAGKFWLEIVYSKEKNWYSGNRFHGEKFDCGAFGRDWDSFFSHFTNLGVSQDTSFDGE